jgi:hypothetical protein
MGCVNGWIELRNHINTYGSNGMYVTLTANISGVNSSIPNFNGNFNGNGATIDMMMNTFESGLFGTLGANANVSNLQVSGIIPHGDNNTGGLARINNGRIENVTSSVSIVHAPHFVGGLVGTNGASGQIINSFASGSIVASNTAGGLVGVNQGTIINSSAISVPTVCDDCCQPPELRDPPEIPEIGIIYGRNAGSVS